MPDGVLDTYLQQVARGLRSLPASDRDDTVAELRSHLDLLVAGLMVQGLSRAEAELAAVERFGKAGSLGRAIDRAGRRFLDRSGKRLIAWYAGYAFVQLGALVLTLFAVGAVAEDIPRLALLPGLPIALAAPAAYLGVQRVRRRISG